MSKLQRNYRIEIDIRGQDTIVIVPPLTINFTVTRRYQSSLNTMQLDIHNISKKYRDLIFQDFFDDREKKVVRLFAGYDELSLLFEGSLVEAYSTRDGTDIITHISGKDASWDTQNTYTYQTINKGQTVGDILDFLAGQFTDLEKGAIGDYNDVLARPVVLNGQTYELLKQYSDGDVMIDNGRIYVMKENEVLDGVVPLINNKSGIISTPRRTEGIVQVQTLLETQLTIGGQARFESSIEPVYNGEYKVIGLVHQGTISGAVSGTCVTTIDFQVQDEVFKTVT